MKKLREIAAKLLKPLAEVSIFDVLFMLGLVLFFRGVWKIYIPAAQILGGLGLMVVSFRHLARRPI
jgi:small neutral amino acid transporter SnatA (MarC family)